MTIVKFLWTETMVQIPWFNSFTPIPQHSIAAASTLRVSDAQAFIACQTLPDTIQNLLSRTEPRWMHVSSQSRELVSSLSSTQSPILPHSFFPTLTGYCGILWWRYSKGKTNFGMLRLSWSKKSFHFSLCPSRTTPLAWPWIKTTDPNRSARSKLCARSLWCISFTSSSHPWFTAMVSQRSNWHGFPCVIHEAKSDSSTLFFAENQAAGAAAKALILQEQLSTAASIDLTLPNTAFCSQDYNWEVWVALRNPNERIVSGMIKFKSIQVFLCLSMCI